MCSLSYLPQKEGFILSHNRDELPQRESSSTLEEREDVGLKGFFPQDLKAGGTWMGVHESGWTLCLLNGGSIPYLRKLPYAYSRGKVILNFFQNPNLEELQKESFEGVEPFTLILARAGELWQLQHDPNANHWKALNPNEAHFWSSTKLYHPNIRAAREARFRRWLGRQETISAGLIESFHLDRQLSAKEGGLLLDSGFILETVSFCQAEYQNNQLDFRYHYLLQDQKDQKSILL